MLPQRGRNVKQNLSVPPSGWRGGGGDKGGRDGVPGGSGAAAATNALDLCGEPPVPASIPRRREEGRVANAAVLRPLSSP